MRARARDILSETRPLSASAGAAVRVLELARTVTHDDSDAITAMVGATIIAAGESDEADAILLIAADAIEMARAYIRTREARLHGRGSAAPS